jgi:hypothetical protein
MADSSIPLQQPFQAPQSPEQKAPQSPEQRSQGSPPQQPQQPSQGAPQSPKASQATTPQPPRPEAQQDLPKGPVWDGDHEDHSWRAAAAKKLSARSRFEQVLVQAGPKRHPFPEGKVHVEEVAFSDGTRKVRYFRDQKEAETWRDQSKEQGVEVRTLSAPKDEEQAQRARAERMASATLPQTSPPAQADASNNAPVQSRIDSKTAVDASWKSEVRASGQGAAGSQTVARMSKAQRKERGLE